MAALKAELPWEQIRMLKRTFTESFGIDVFGSEKQLRKYLGTLEIPYETGSHVTSDSKTVHFARVTDIKFVITSMVQELIASKSLNTPQNIPNDTLYVLLADDKGGSSTKILLQLLNADTEKQHSVRFAKLIGIFEGDKDNRECVEAIFGDLIRSVQETCNKISSLHLKNHSDGECQVNQSSFDTFELKGSQSLPSQLCKVDNANSYVSSKCKQCQVMSSNATPILQSKAESHPSCEKEKQSDCEFQRSLLVLGGDWAWLAVVLGLTGAKGLQFCRDCLCKLSDLEKGKSHTPIPLEKYNDNLPNKTEFQVRTFEIIESDNVRYNEDGWPKSKMKEYNNCEYLPLFRGNGPVLHTTS